MKKLNVALIGGGAMGKRWVKAIQKTKGAWLVLVCDKDIKRASELADEVKGCEIEKDFKRAAKHPDIDAAIIVLPHTLLADASGEFLKNKKHVLCEKPCGISSKEVAANIARASKNKVVYMAGFNHRFHDGFLKARKYFERGVIGEPLFIRARYGFGGRKGYEEEWRLNKKQGGGELLDQGVHMIDLARWFLGGMLKVRGFTGNLFWHSKGRAEDNAFVILKNKNSMASIHVSWTMWKANHVFELYGTKGYLVVDGLGKKYLGDYGDGEKLLLGRRTKDFKADEKIITCNQNADVSLEKELEEFVRSIREKRNPVPSGEDALEVLKIVEKVYGQNK